MSRYWYRSIVISGLLPLMFATGTTRAQHPELTVFVYDYAGLPGGTMGELGEVTELLLSQAGVDAHWILCRGVTLGPLPGECAGALQSGEIALRILTNCGVTVAGPVEVLGSAVSPGGYITICSRQVLRTAPKKRVNPQVLMAYAVLHEIAHLFLGPRHQPVGVMRGCWTSSEYLAMSTLDLGFTKREKETLRRSVLAAKVPASERLLSADEGSVRIRNK